MIDSIYWYKGNQSWIFIGRTEAEAETPKHFDHLMRRTDSLGKTLMLGKTEGRRRGQQRIRQLDGITDSMDMSLNKLLRASDGQGGLTCCSPWGQSQTWLSWATKLNWYKSNHFFLLCPSHRMNEVLRHKMPYAFTLFKGARKMQLGFHKTFSILFQVSLRQSVRLSPDGLLIKIGSRSIITTSLTSSSVVSLTCLLL